MPLLDRALEALDELPLRLGGLLVTAPKGGYLSLRNWRRREWRPALRSAGLAICTCGHTSAEHDPRACESGSCHCRTFRLDTTRGVNRTPYALRHTYASNLLAAGEPALAVAKYMGTSLAMIDRTYGHLIRGSEAATIERINARREGLWHLYGTDAVDEGSR